MSRNPKLWQSLPVEKHNKLENSSEFIAIKDELKSLILEPIETLIARDRRKELRAQKRKLVSEELRKFKKLQPLKPSTKANKGELLGSHRTQFPRVSGLIPVRRRLASDLFRAVSIRSDTGRAVLRDMIDLC